MTKQWKWKLPLKKQAPEPLKAEKQLKPLFVNVVVNILLTDLESSTISIL